MLKFGVVDARVAHPAVYLILDGYSGVMHEGKSAFMHEGKWPSLSSACATESEIDYCVKIHKEALDKAAVAAKRMLKKLKEADPGPFGSP